MALRSIRGFTESYPAANAQSIQVDPRFADLSDAQDVAQHFIYQQDPGQDIRLSHFMVWMLQMITDASSTVELISAVLSFIGEMLPGLQNLCAATFSDIGYQRVEVKLPQERVTQLLEPVNTIDSKYTWIYLGQLCLLLFKNVSQANYNNFMLKRTQALKAAAGVPPSDVVAAVVSLDKAEQIRSMLGASNTFRKGVLLELLAIGRRYSNYQGRISLYVTNIARWTEMSGIVFINEMLIKTRSPVLRDPRVAQEVISLKEAIVKIVESEYPQYFRILADPLDYRILERSRFPTLHSVAHEVKKKQQGSVGQYVQTSIPTSDLVSSLVNLHEHHVFSAPVSQHEEVLEYLFEERASQASTP